MEMDKKTFTDMVFRRKPSGVVKTVLTRQSITLLSRIYGWRKAMSRRV